MSVASAEPKQEPSISDRISNACEWIFPLMLIGGALWLAGAIVLAEKPEHNSMKCEEQPHVECVGYIKIERYPKQQKIQWRWNEADGNRITLIVYIGDTEDRLRAYRYEQNGQLMKREWREGTLFAERRTMKPTDRYDYEWGYADSFETEVWNSLKLNQ